MGIPAHVSPPRTAAWLAGLVALIAACGPGGGNNNAAVHSQSPAVSPQASPTASPIAQPTANPAPPHVTGAYGVLYGSQAANTYAVSIIGIDGRVVASADASTPALASCGGTAAALYSPPVSMSDSRVYFMDAQGAVHWLQPDGAKDQAPIASLPASTASRRSMFAVSPDDSEMAVVVDDFTTGGAKTTLSMYDLNSGGSQRVLFSESGSFTLWPIGWHGTTNLVLAKVASCTQGGRPFCCGPLELHVVDPATAARRFTLGGSGCVVAGAPSPAGVACEDPSAFTKAVLLNWTGGTADTFPIAGPVFADVAPSPGALQVALVNNTGTSFTQSHSVLTGMFACTWIDDDHVLSGGDAQHQPRVANPATGQQVPVAAQGDCAGRLPGGL